MKNYQVRIRIDKIHQEDFKKATNSTIELGTSIKFNLANGKSTTQTLKSFKILRKDSKNSEIDISITADIPDELYKSFNTGDSNSKDWVDFSLQKCKINNHSYLSNYICI